MFVMIDFPVTFPTLICNFTSFINRSSILISCGSSKFSSYRKMDFSFPLEFI